MDKLKIVKAWKEKGHVVADDRRRRERRAGR
jgi:hypothetical protein